MYYKPAGESMSVTLEYNHTPDIDICNVGSTGSFKPVPNKEVDHGIRLLIGLQHLREQKQLFDVILVASGQEFPAHRVVLASCSDYFRAMFTDGLRECSQSRVVLEGITALEMEHLIEFAYTSNLNINNDNVASVLSGASHVQILPVIAACETYLCENLTIENCIEVNHLAYVFFLQHLLDYTHSFICKHWLHLTRTADFEGLTEQQMQGILASHYPVNCCEVDVLMGVLNWANFSPSARIPALYNLLQHIMFDNMQLEELKQVRCSALWQQLIQVDCKLQDSILSLTDINSAGLGISEVSSDIARIVPGVKNTRGYSDVILLIGGFNTDAGMNNNIVYFTPSSKTFTFLTRIPHVNQCDFGTAVLDNKVYVFGGCFNEHMQEVPHPFGFCFDPTNNIWKSLPPMQQERCRFFLGTLDGKLYAIGGEVDTSQSFILDTASCETYNPTSGSWSSIAPLPANRAQLAGTSYDGKLYVSGGIQDGIDVAYTDFWSYNPDTDKWVSCSALLTPRANHTMFTHNGNIYVIGGWIEFDEACKRTANLSIDCYDPRTDTWRRVQYMRTPRIYATYTLFKGYVYVIGGWRSGLYQEKCQFAEVLDLNTMQWLPIQLPMREVWEHSSVCVCLPKNVNNQVLFDKNT